MQAPLPRPIQPQLLLQLPGQPLPPPQAAALSAAGEETLLQFFAVKDTPSSEEIRFLARNVCAMPAALLPLTRAPVMGRDAPGRCTIY